MIEKMSVLRMVAQAVRLFVSAWRHLILVAFPVQFPVAVLGQAVLSVVPPGPALTSFSSIDLVAAGARWLVLLVVGSLGALGYVLVVAATTRSVCEAALGRVPTVAASYRHAVARLRPLAGAILLAWAIVVGLIVLIAGLLSVSLVAILAVAPAEVARSPAVGLVLLLALGACAAAVTVVLGQALVKWAVFIQVVLLERAGPVAALRRSADLVRGNWWRTLAVLFLLIVAQLAPAAVLAAILDVPVALVGVLVAWPVESALWLVSAATNAAFSPISAVGLALLYIDLRVRAEGYSADRLARDLSSSAG